MNVFFFEIFDNNSISSLTPQLYKLYYQFFYSCSVPYNGIPPKTPLKYIFSRF